MNHFHLAQVNIAKTLAPLDHPIMKDFMDNLDAIYKISDVHDGFILRLDNADYLTELKQAFPDDSFIVNISVWKDLDLLFDFTYKSGHVEVFKRRKEWFNKIEMKYMAFWYVSEGKTPTHLEAKARLDYLNTHGETPFAFSFKSKFSVEDSLKYKALLH